MDTKFAIEPVWSWLTIAFIAIGLMGLVALTYPPRVKHLATGTRRFLITMRLLAAALLVVAMLRPEVQYTEHDLKSAVMFVVGDASRSMSTQDGPQQTTRRETLVKMLDENAERFQKIEKLIEIRRFDFDSELRPMETLPDSQTPNSKATGVMTAIGAALEPLLKEAQSKRVVGIILLSDGAQRALPPFEIDPRSIARRLGQQQMPIYGVPIGESTLSDSAFDYAVEDLVVSPVVFEKNTVPVQAKIRIAGAAGKPVTVQLLVEDRSGAGGAAGPMIVPRAAGDARPTKVITTTQNNATETVELSWVPDLPGEFKIAVRVVPAEGEVKTTNNQRETLVTVQRGGVKVAYFDAAREEQKFLRTVNQAKQIQLDFHWVRSGTFAGLTKIDPAMFQAGRYDVYIIGDVPAAVFGEAQLRDLSRRIDEGAGFMMLGGLQSFGAGGYATTPLADVMPVAMTAQERQANGEFASDLHYDQDLKMLPTDAGLKHFIMRLSLDKNAEKWGELPALRGANKLRLKNEFSQVLATSPDRIPLLFSLEAGRSRVLAFAGDTTFRWATAEKPFVEEHQRFWRQVLLWLARKENESDQPVWVRCEPRNFAPGAQVPIEFGARGEDGLPIKDAEFKVSVIGPGPESMPVQLAAQRLGDRPFARFDQAVEPGTYRVAVSALRNGQSFGNATTRFLVDPRDLEMDNPAADPDLLKELSALTGGRMLSREQLSEFLDDLIENGPSNLDDVRITRRALWDNWWFLSAFVAVMSAEWFVRKRRGLV